MSGILVVRLRGDIHVRADMSETMKRLNLTRQNHATVVPDTPEYRGMVKHVKDWCTFGSISAGELEKLLTARGRAIGNQPLTDKVLADHSEFKSIKEYAEALSKGETSLGVRRLVEGSKTRQEWVVKPVIRLSPPKGGHEGIKHSFTSHGALGDRGGKINEFVSRMV